jgi:hypothetical protein
MHGGFGEAQMEDNEGISTRSIPPEYHGADDEQVGNGRRRGDVFIFSDEFAPVAGSGESDFVEVCRESRKSSLDGESENA